jgi:hypothetical protein
MNRFRLTISVVVRLKCSVCRGDRLATPSLGACYDNRRLAQQVICIRVEGG